MITAEIEHCNNIELAKINIKKNILNIKYAMNGTGKSTIAKAIEFAAKKQPLESLKTFGGTSEPLCNIDSPINNVLVFNEEFVDTFVFTESEVIQNAFDVFIKTPDYEQKQNLINERLKAIHIDTSQNQGLNTLLSTGITVLGKFKKTQSNELRQSGLIKKLTNAESIYRLPEPIKQFQPLMEKEYTVDWVGWKNDGFKFDDNKICPFCSKTLPQNYDTEKKIFTESYSKSNVQSIKEMLSYFDAVTDYMDSAKRELLYRCIKESEDKETINLWVKKFYLDLEYLVLKIRKVIEFNSYDVKSEDLSKLGEHLRNLLIDSNNLEIFNNQKTIKIIDLVNERILALLKETDDLKQEIGQLKSVLVSRINSSVKDINNFLNMAGINYKLEIRPKDENNAQTILKYKCSSENEVEVNNINLHLSWGEKNAFALVLFMHYALSENPDLIILDDPISSFDSNKKYAIINRLFLNNDNKESFYKKTVMMLTHDFEPIIDFISNKKPNGGSANASFLKNKEGKLAELDITDKDIKSLPILLAENAKDESINKIHRLISLRKLFEHTIKDNGGNLAYNLLSCLLKGYNCPQYKDDSKIKPNDIALGEKIIKEYIDDFSYHKYLNDIFNQKILVELYKNELNNYFKLQIFRVLIEVAKLRSKIKENQPLLKYIDEQFHIENDYIFYLDLNKFDIVPDFIIPTCTEFLQTEGVL